MPGSRTMASRGTPAATADSSCWARNAVTSATTSAYRGSACIVAGSPRLCIITAPAPPPASLSSWNLPPSEKESGVTFRTPITRVRRTSHSTPLARHTSGSAPIGRAIRPALLEDGYDGFLWRAMFRKTRVRLLLLGLDSSEIKVGEKALPSVEDLPAGE